MTHDQEVVLLRFVRQTAEDHLSGGALAVVPAFAKEVPYGGVFTTLRNGERLRGCMGALTAKGPFADMLAEVTRSALRDPRFSREAVTIEELPALRIEVSILGPIKVVSAVEELVAGHHGVVVSLGGRSGCFLPQVASERGWSMETFLSECCRQKAGLEATAWRDPAARIEAFEVMVLRESPG
jgi:AmmeMemoRadiSam system protein A